MDSFWFSTSLNPPETLSPAVRCPVSVLPSSALTDDARCRTITETVSRSAGLSLSATKTLKSRSL